MTCQICGRHKVYHGSEWNAGGYGCHDGMLMDDDVHAEGWQRDVIYPPCPHNPRKCSRCDGSGSAPADVTTQDDCPDCSGTGWAGGKCEWPSPAREDAAKIDSLEKERDGLRTACDHNIAAVKKIEEFAIEANSRAEAAESKLAAADAENARLQESLTPSGTTKADYIGEFKFYIEDTDEDGFEFRRSITVPWTTIKEIMKAILDRAALTGAPPPS